MTAALPARRPQAGWSYEMMIIAMALAIAALMVTGGPPNVAQILVVPMLMVAVRRGLVDREPPREDGIGFAGWRASSG
jgi:hypothetical protein